MPISRRKFLQVAGLTLGASVVNVLPAWAAGLQRVGVIMPNTLASQQWFTGLQRKLRTQNAHAQRNFYRTTPSHTLETAAMLSRRPLVGLVVFGTPTQYADLAAWATAHHQRIWFSTLGANVADLSSNTVSLNLWQANYAFGQAAAKFGGRAGLVASARDAGYDSLYALQAGFEQAGGGVIETGLTHTPNTVDANLLSVLQTLARTSPDVVLASYQGQAAHEFVAAYQQAGFTAPLFLSGTAAQATPSGAWTWAVRGSRHTDSVFTVLGERTAQKILASLGARSGESTAPQFELRQAGSFLNQPQPLATERAAEFLQMLDPIRSGWLMDYGTF